MPSLYELDQLPAAEAERQLRRACGSRRWAREMMAARPFRTHERLFRRAREIWEELDPEDWLEAFAQHPRIGDLESLSKRFAGRGGAWSESEQSGVEGAPREALRRLALGNLDYEEKFGFLFIVCATGKSAEEMLEILERRLENDPETELRVAAAEQAKITRLRLEKLLGEIEGRTEPRNEESGDDADATG